MVVDRRRAVGLAVLVAAVLVGWSPVPHAVLAADPSGPAGDPLAGPFVDVALVAAPVLGGSAGDPPALVVASPPSATYPSVVHLELLVAKGGEWTRTASTDLATGLMAAGAARLVPLGPGGRGELIAVVASDAAADLTFVGLVEIGPDAIVSRHATLVTGGEVAVGTADVRGNGRPELVLGVASFEAATIRGSPGDCPRTSLVMIDPATLVVSGVVPLDGLALEGGAIGRFSPGGRAGLVAYARTTCAVADNPVDAVVAVDLARGASQVLAVDPPATDPPGSPVPLVADLDRDGIDEAIVRSGSSTAVVDPQRGWAPETIDAAGVPVAVVDARERPRVVIDEAGVDGSTPRLAMFAIGRARVGGALVRQGLTAIDTGSRGSTAGASGIGLAFDPSAPPPAWLGDLDGNGCTTLLVPGGAFVRCPDAPADWTSRTGPGWIQTVPLASVPGTDSRELLVAAGVGWATARSALAVPAPAAASAVAAAGWRTGPSPPFRLVMIPSSDVGGSSPAGPAAPRVELPGPGAASVVGGPGDRLFVRYAPAVGADRAGPAASAVPGLPAGAPPGTGPAGTPPDASAGYLLSPPLDGLGSVFALPIAEWMGSTSGAGTASLPLPAPQRGRWTIDALAIDTRGNVSPVVVADLDLDPAPPVARPSLTAPLISAPWPFAATIGGSAAPGTRIRVAGGALEPVGPDGRFAIEARLAPWPQDVVVEAVDPSGRLSTQTLSVVGGLDYRQLPWQPLLILGVLLAVAVSTVRRPSLGSPAVRVAADDDPGPIAGRAGRRDAAPRWAERSSGDEVAEIEDLPAPARPRPAR